MKRQGSDDVVSMTLKIPPEFWSEILFVVRQATPMEVSGLGEIEMEKNRLVLSKLHYLKQQVSGGSTVLDSKDLADLLMKIENPERLKFWWHSHANMGVFWSGTDTTTIATLRGDADWIVSLVVNAAGEYLCRLDVQRPLPLPMIPVVLKVETALSKERKLELKAWVEENVKEHGSFTAKVDDEEEGSSILERWKRSRQQSAMEGDLSTQKELELNYGAKKCGACLHFSSMLSESPEKCPLNGRLFHYGPDTPGCSSWYLGTEAQRKDRGKSS